LRTIPDCTSAGEMFQKVPKGIQSATRKLNNIQKEDFQKNQTKETSVLNQEECRHTLRGIFAINIHGF
jgi:hypothetical protein